MIVNILKQPNWNIANVTEIVCSMSASGSNKQGARSMSVTLLKNDINIQCGDWLQVVDENYDFVGQVLKVSKEDNESTISIACEDTLIHMTNSTCNKVVNSTPEAIATEFCNYFGTAIGNIESTGIATGNKAYKSKTYFDILTDLYGSAYKIVMKGAYFYIYKKGHIVDYVLDDSNISNIKYEEDATDIVNRIVKYNDDGTIEKVYDDDNIGIMAIFEKIESSKSENATTIINGRHKELVSIKNEMVVSAIGDNACVSGEYIRMYDSINKLIIIYEIVNDKHTWSDKTHTMDLTLEFKEVSNEWS